MLSNKRQQLFVIFCWKRVQGILEELRLDWCKKFVGIMKTEAAHSMLKFMRYLGLKSKMSTNSTDDFEFVKPILYECSDCDSYFCHHILLLNHMISKHGKVVETIRNGNLVKIVGTDAEKEKGDEERHRMQKRRQFLNAWFPYFVHLYDGNEMKFGFRMIFVLLIHVVILIVIQYLILDVTC